MYIYKLTASAKLIFKKLNQFILPAVFEIVVSYIYELVMSLELEGATECTLTSPIPSLFQGRSWVFGTWNDLPRSYPEEWWVFPSLKYVSLGGIFLQTHCILQALADCLLLSPLLCCYSKQAAFSVSHFPTVSQDSALAILSAWTIFHLISLKSYLLPLFKTHLIHRVYGLLQIYPWV